MKALPVAVLGATCALLGSTSAQAQERRYTYVPVGSFATHTSGWSAVRDVNAAGQLAGEANVSTLGYARAIRSSDGQLTNLGELGRSGQSIAWGLNDAGDVVGQTHVSRYEPSHLFLYRDGQMTDLGTGYGSGSFSFGNEINEAGWIVGDRGPGGSAPRRGFVWRNGTFTDLGSLGGTGGAHNIETSAEDINERGQIVGSSVPAKGYPLHAYVWENGTMRDLGTLGGPDTEGTQAFAINNRGQIAGWGQAPSLETQGFVWEDGRMRPLGDLGGDYSRPTDINDRGEIVGSSNVAHAPVGADGHAFLWADGELHDLNDLVTNLPANVQLTVATAINEDGVIAGYTCGRICDPGKTAVSHGFMLVPEGRPVPTPKPNLLDTSGYARPVTVAGPAPTAATGRWGDALRFAGGRLETPAFEIPLQHSLFAYIQPDAGGGEQHVVGSSSSRLMYDGTNRRVTFSVTDASGRVITASTPPGSLTGTGFRLVDGGIGKKGEVVVAIDGRTYCSATRVTSIGPSVAPISVGAGADGGRPFRGVIEGAGVSPTAIAVADSRLPWWESNPAGSLITFYFDADQAVQDRQNLVFPAPPTVSKTACRVS